MPSRDENAGLDDWPELTDEMWRRITGQQVPVAAFQSAI